MKKIVISRVSGNVGKMVSGKMKSVPNKNSGYKTLCSISQILTGDFFSTFSIEGELASVGTVQVCSHCVFRYGKEFLQVQECAVGQQVLAHLQESPHVDCHLSQLLKDLNIGIYTVYVHFRVF
jgi:hypothetical protein